MSKKLKILVIRFSSIGDIILTTPIIRCLKLQLESEIDFLTKDKYVELLTLNPNIRKIFSFGRDDVNEKIRLLKSEEHDIVIDLQNNLQSFKVRRVLKADRYVVRKKSFKRYLLIYLGVNLLKDHIVDRYFRSIESLNILNDNQGVDYFIGPPPKMNFNINQDYIVWCIGATHKRKKLSIMQVSSAISKLPLPVILLGGPQENEEGMKIINNCNGHEVYNFCGKTSINASAYLMQKSKLVLTNDTGMMHISSAFDVPIISFWGCTKPSLGFSAYFPHKDSKNIITNLSNRPCSKHGRYCRVSSEGCIKGINPKQICDTVLELLK